MAQATGRPLSDTTDFEADMIELLTSIRKQGLTASPTLKSCLQKQELILRKRDAESTAPMTPFLDEWWDLAISDLEDFVPAARFLERLVEWYTTEPG